jgi:DNA-binding transcriptional regulator YiaG
MVDEKDGLVSALISFRSANRVPRERVSREMGTAVSTLYRWEKGLSAPTGLCRAALEKYLKKNGARR